MHDVLPPTMNVKSGGTILPNKGRITARRLNRKWETTCPE